MIRAYQDQCLPSVTVQSLQNGLFPCAVEERVLRRHRGGCSSWIDSCSLRWAGQISRTIRIHCGDRFCLTEIDVCQHSHSTLRAQWPTLSNGGVHHVPHGESVRHGSRQSRAVTQQAPLQGGIELHPTCGGRRPFAVKNPSPRGAFVPRTPSRLRGRENPQKLVPRWVDILPRATLHPNRDRS